MPRAGAAIAVVLLCASAACGGGEDRPPEEVAREYVASDDPGKCDDADLGFLERQTGEKGEAARDVCRRNVERSDPPREVRVSRHDVEGERATVLLDADGQRVRVTLRRSGGRWLVAGLG